MNNTVKYGGGGFIEDNNSFEIKDINNKRIIIYLKWANKVTTPVVVVRLVHYYFIITVVVIRCAVVEVILT